MIVIGVGEVGSLGRPPAFGRRIARCAAADAGAPVDEGESRSPDEAHCCSAGRFALILINAVALSPPVSLIPTELAEKVDVSANYARGSSGV